MVIAALITRYPAAHTSREDSVLVRVIDTALVDSLAIQSVLVAGKPDRFRLELIVWNPSITDAIATHLQITSSATADVVCKGTFNRFVLSDHLQLYSQGGGRARVSTSVTPTTGELATYSIPVTGELFAGCGQQRLTLAFDASVPLTAHAHTSIYMDIPRKLQVSQSRSGASDPLMSVKIVSPDLLARDFQKLYAQTFGARTDRELRVQIATDRDTLRFTKRTITEARELPQPFPR
jgi:hypothetical protein